MTLSAGSLFGALVLLLLKLEGEQPAARVRVSAQAVPRPV
jgi:hypothetical protein